MPPKISAEDNHWYLLATLYGVPGKHDEGLREKNRTAWNRYLAADLDEKIRARLITEKRHTAEELVPYSPEEWQTKVAERCKASAKDPEQVVADLKDDVIIDFSNVEFEHDASFKQYIFSRHASFRDAAFRSSADFAGATIFHRGANFGGATFFWDANFDGANFAGSASFCGGKFYHSANFSRSNLGLASFIDVKFFGAAYFVDTTFAQWGHFQRAAFIRLVTFGGATFSEEANFDEAIFCRRADFGKGSANGKGNITSFCGITSFVNAEMKQEVSFEGAVFKTEPPRFFGARLHQSTVWRGIKWPLPKNKNEAGTFIDAYACLKLEMDRLKKHEDELEFFAHELGSRRVHLGPWRGLPIALYELLSNYGRSYLRPFAAIVVLSIIGAGVFWYFDARSFGEASALSAANALNIFGFRRDSGLETCTPLAWLKVFSAIQTILGAILLFLVGLGIRNKFRMK